MKKHHYILGAFTALMLQGCGLMETPQSPCEGEEVCELVITLDTSELRPREAGTRASIWDDKYPEEAAISFENDVESVTLYLVTEDNSSIALTPEKDIEGGKPMTFKTKVNVNNWYVLKNDGKYYLNGKIVAVANHPNPDSNISPFSQPHFEITSIQKNRLIPMWGIASLNRVELKPNETIMAGNIKLLRSVPKITIELDEEIRDLYNITDVTPERSDYPNYAYPSPEGGRTVSSTGALSIEGCFNPCTMQATQGLQFYGLGSDVVYAYPAEREITEADRTPARLLVTLAREDGKGEPVTGYIKICDYKNGLPIDGTGFAKLVRNHDYRFVLTLKELEFLVSFSEWTFGGKVHVELE